MRILIIGGTGTISTAVMRELIARGHEVILFNRGSTPVPGARVICGDRYNHAGFAELLRGEGSFDCVLEMIGYAPDDAQSLIDVFSGRTKQLVFCSTVDVYRKPAPSYPVREGAPRWADPRFTYAANKVEMEHMLEHAASDGAFALTIVRPAATYCDASLPIAFLESGLGLLRRIREGKPVLVLGEGSSLWAYAHRDDVGRAIANAAGNPATYGRDYIIASEESMTWAQLYAAVARAMDAPEPRLVPVPTELLMRVAPQDAAWCDYNFRFNNVFDNAAAKADLGYQYTIRWEEGVARMLAHHAGSIAAAPLDPRVDALADEYFDWTARIEGALRQPNE